MISIVKQLYSINTGQNRASKNGNLQIFFLEKKWKNSQFSLSISFASISDFVIFKGMSTPQTLKRKIRTWKYYPKHINNKN